MVSYRKQRSRISNRCLIPGNTLFRTSVTLQIWSFKVRRLVRNNEDRPAMFDIWRPAFHSHSKSLEYTLDRSVIHDFPLMLHSDHGPFSYCFGDEDWYLQTVPKPLCLMLRLMGFHLEFCNDSWARIKLRWCHKHQNVWRYIHSLRHSTGIVRGRDRRTDRSGKTVSRLHAMMRDKKMILRLLKYFWNYFESTNKNTFTKLF